MLVLVERAQSSSSISSSIFYRETVRFSLHDCCIALAVFVGHCVDALHGHLLCALSWRSHGFMLCTYCPYCPFTSHFLYKKNHMPVQNAPNTKIAHILYNSMHIFLKARELSFRTKPSLAQSCCKLTFVWCGIFRCVF